MPSNQRPTSPRPGSTPARASGAPKPGPTESGSLMDGILDPPASSAATPADARVSWVRRAWGRTLSVLATRTAIIAIAAVVLAGITIGAIRLIPTTKPDPFAAEVTDVAGFVFDEDFNRLPPRERLGFLVDLIKRFRDFDENDAVALSNLLAQMNDAMRAQIEENIRRLAVDLMSESAREYADLSPEERAAYLNQLLLEMDMLGDEVSGRDRDDTEDERLARMQRQAERDQARAQQRGGESLQPERVQGFFEMYQETATQVNAVDRGRIAVLMRDMSRHLRGEPLDP